jgi:hypothetical protein
VTFAFISYSRNDAEYARRLATHLSEASIPCWYDQDVASGARFTSVIEEKLNACAVVVVICSVASQASNWVRREMHYASDIDKPLMPLMLEPCQPSILLSGINHHDVIGGRMPPPSFVDDLRAQVGAVRRPRMIRPSPAFSDPLAEVRYPDALFPQIMPGRSVASPMPATSYRADETSPARARGVVRTFAAAIAALVAATTATALRLSLGVAAGNWVILAMRYGGAGLAVFALLAGLVGIFRGPRGISLFAVALSTLTLLGPFLLLGTWP